MSAMLRTLARRYAINERAFLEWALVLSTIGLGALIVGLNSHKGVILNLFYLPLVLSGFYLGRYRAGVMAVLCVIVASLVVSHDPQQFSASHSTVMVGLAMVIWGAVLCLTALVVGTLSDERNAKVQELHEAYVGVVEVLSRYLQSANPRLKDRASRVAELCQKVAGELRLSPQQTDDIRVAALMQDLGRIEVTTRLVARAVDTLETSSAPHEQHSFQGIDLVHSLGSVLRGAIPMLLSSGDARLGSDELGAQLEEGEIPLGAKIIRAARAFDAMTESGLHGQWASPGDALRELRADPLLRTEPRLLDAFEQLILAGQPVTTAK